MGDFDYLGVSFAPALLPRVPRSEDYSHLLNGEADGWREQEATSSLPAPFCGIDMTICRVSLKKLSSRLANFATC